MDWLVTILWIVGGVLALLLLLFTAVLGYLIKTIGFRNLQLILTHLILLKAYFKYRDRFFR